MQFGPGVRGSVKVPVTWQELVDDSDRVDYSLEETKKEFSETTRKQVNGSNGRGGGSRGDPLEQATDWEGGYARDRC